MDSLPSRNLTNSLFHPKLIVHSCCFVFCGFCKYMTYIQYESVMQNHFTALKALCVPASLLFSFLSFYLFWVSFTSYILVSFFSQSFHNCSLSLQPPPPKNKIKCKRKREKKKIKEKRKHQSHHGSCSVTQ